MQKRLQRSRTDRCPRGHPGSQRIYRRERQCRLGNDLPFICPLRAGYRDICR
jgi:hypothetical protein